MKALLALMLIMSPVFAAQDAAITLTAEQQAACDAEGGCLLITRKAVLSLHQLGVQEGLERCKSTI